MASPVIQAIKETLLKSTFHSIPNIVRNKNLFIKVLWMICLIISCSYCSFLIYEAVLDYLSYDVISTTKEVFKNPLMFPKLTICSLNYFATSFSQTSREILSLFNESWLDNNENISYKANYQNVKLTAIAYANYLNDTIKKQVGFTIDQIILSCIFNNVDCNLETDFVPYFDSLYGNCFKYNIDDSKQISMSGSMNGLQLELFSQNSAKENYNEFSMYNGFIIFVSNQSWFNTYNVDGLLIPTGFLTNVVLKKLSINKYPKPYSNCIKNLNSIDSYNSISYKKAFQLNKNKYNFLNCLDMCFQLFVGETCGCYDSTSGPFPNSDRKPCLNTIDLNCDNDAWSLFLEENLFYKCDCPYECNFVEYEYSSSIADYPSHSYAKYLSIQPDFVKKFSNLYKNQSKIGYRDIKPRIASVNIFYNALVETIKDEVAKQKMVDLISNIGGILSLFLGISFLSFVEFLEVISKVILTLYKVYTSKKTEPDEKIDNSKK